jgi:hypothetical protein
MSNSATTQTSLYSKVVAVIVPVSGKFFKRNLNEFYSAGLYSMAVCRLADRH